MVHDNAIAPIITLRLSHKKNEKCGSKKNFKLMSK